MTDTTHDLPGAGHTDPGGYPPAGPATTGPAPAVDPYPPATSTGNYYPPAAAPQPHRRRMAAAVAITAVLASGLTGAGVTVIDHHNTQPAAAATAAPLAAGQAPNWVAVAAAVEPSVVAVRVTTSSGGDEGSGVILDTSGRILTNNHVIAGGGTITVALADGNIYPATVVGADPSTDLAVLRLTNPPSGLKPATFGNSAALRVGDPVMAVGNPLGLSDTVTTGIVSALNRPVATSDAPTQQQSPFGQSSTTPQQEPVVTNAIQTDAAVNPGNSGGALVNTAGQVIGITSSIASLDTSSTGQSGSIGLGFAIPAAEATNIAHQIITTGSVEHAYIGVTFTDGTVTAGGTQHNAAIIASVAAGTPAAKAGLKAHDAIIAINGQPLDDADSLIAQVRAMNPGTAITLTIASGGTTHTATVTLAARPDQSTN